MCFGYKSEQRPMVELDEPQKVGARVPQISLPEWEALFMLSGSERSNPYLQH